VGQEPEGEQEFDEQWSEGNPFVKECDPDKQEFVGEFVGNGLISQEFEVEGKRLSVEPEGYTMGMKQEVEKQVTEGTQFEDDGIVSASAGIDAWPPEAEWPVWWSYLPDGGFAIIMELRAMAAPYSATMKAIEYIGNETFDITRLARGLAACASLFGRLCDTLAADLALHVG
jgi:hypothetical protein